MMNRPTSRIRTAGAGRARSGAFKNPCRPGRLRHGPHLVLHRLRDGSAAARRSTSTSSAAPPHPNASSRRHHRVAVSAWHATARRRTRARRSTCCWRSSTRHGRPAADRATFLLDEVLELRTFESFPGLRHVLRDLFDALATSPNRFVLTTRYVARAHRLLRDATARFEVMHLLAADGRRRHRMLAPAFNGYEQMPADERDYLGRAVQALTDGRARVRPRRSAKPWPEMGRHRRSDQRAHGAAVARTARSIAGAGSATSCACIAPAATARSRRFSTSWRRRSR